MKSAMVRKKEGESADVKLRSISVFYFFFSSRRRHTRLQGDWSSDVCSSDLLDGTRLIQQATEIFGPSETINTLFEDSRGRLWVGGDRTVAVRENGVFTARSEERRVGKEGRSRWAPYH